MAHPLLRPRWIAAHLALGAVVAAFLALGAWQLRRLDEVDAANARITARLAEPVGTAETAFAGPAADHRRARITGRYDTAAEWLLLSRSHRGISGHHVLTPLRTAAGAVLVNRGWVPLAEDEHPIEIAAPPLGEVTVEGILLTPATPGRFAPKDAALAARTTFRIDPGAVGRRAGYPIAPLYLLLQRQDPPQPGEHPAVVAPAALDRGPHLSYALQWFAFAVAATGTYVAFAARAVRRPAARAR